MSYTIDEIKIDLDRLTSEQFYTKYIVCSENWYLDNILQLSESDHVYVSEEYRLIISKCLDISINSILLVGSGKIGYSLSPIKSKRFKPFNMDEKVRNISDLDIAIISPVLFSTFWKCIRASYKNIYKSLYEQHIFREIYRGYINERNIEAIDGCRKTWNDIVKSAKKKLMDEFYIKNEITFRLYNSWEDFQDYNIQNIAYLKREVRNEI